MSTLDPKALRSGGAAQRQTARRADLGGLRMLTAQMHCVKPRRCQVWTYGYGEGSEENWLGLYFFVAGRRLLCLPVGDLRN